MAIDSGSLVGGIGNFKSTFTSLRETITSATAITLITPPTGQVVRITYLRAPPTVNGTEFELRIGGRVVVAQGTPIMGADGDTHFDGALAVGIGGGSTASSTTSTNSVLEGGIDEVFELERFAGAGASIYYAYETGFIS